MYLHKENRELFRDAILLTSQKLEVSEDIVEKDYYVTMLLKKLSNIEYPVVFKGGTSLSKAFQVIDRVWFDTISNESTVIKSYTH